MAGRSNSCFSLVALVCLAVECWTEAEARVIQGGQVHGDVQQVRVVASVFCDVCLEGRVSKNSVFLSDVTTIMECKNRSSQTSYYNFQGNTDKTGRFMVELPSNLSEDWQEDCSISVQGPPPGSSCSIPLNSGLSSLRPSKQLLNSEKKKIAYTAGPFIYQPSEAVVSCAQHRYQLRPIALQVLASADSLSLGPPDPPRP